MWDVTGTQDNPKFDQGETWFGYWSRRHAERHPAGDACECAWNRVNIARRNEIRYGD